jgi:hypothetical protein
MTGWRALGNVTVCLIQCERCTHSTWTIYFIVSGNDERVYISPYVVDETSIMASYTIVEISSTSLEFIKVTASVSYVTEQFLFIQ